MYSGKCSIYQIIRSGWEMERLYCQKCLSALLHYISLRCSSTPTTLLPRPLCSSSTPRTLKVTARLHPPFNFVSRRWRGLHGCDGGPGSGKRSQPGAYSSLHWLPVHRYKLPVHRWNKSLSSFIMISRLWRETRDRGGPMIMLADKTGEVKNLEKMEAENFTKE